MSDNQSEKFHKVSLQSTLFKGRSDVYYCYLKSEKIAHVLSLLLRGRVTHPEAERERVASDLLQKSAALPVVMLSLASGEEDVTTILARTYELLVLVRLSASRGLLSESNATLLVREYEGIVERVAGSDGTNVPINETDLTVPRIQATLPVAVPRSPIQAQPLIAPALASEPEASQNSKGHAMSFTAQASEDKQHVRRDSVLTIVRERGKVSIKDLSKTIRDCSEKTIQRELNSLISSGLIRKEGERRWSFYLPVSTV